MDELDGARKHWIAREADPTHGALANRYRAHVEGTAAKCWTLLGQQDSAMECLKAAEATNAGLQPLAALLWGDLLAAAGDAAAAKAKWKLAASHPRPGPHLARELATRLPTPPYRTPE